VHGKVEGNTYVSWVVVFFHGGRTGNQFFIIIRVLSVSMLLVAFDIALGGFKLGSLILVLLSYWFYVLVVIVCYVVF